MVVGFHTAGSMDFVGHSLPPVVAFPLPLLSLFLPLCVVVPVLPAADVGILLLAVGFLPEHELLQPPSVPVSPFVSDVPAE